jgi:NAD(P)-dependent dehydrogenase (short-subunit alcohol dehydrogenase family)
MFSMRALECLVAIVEQRSLTQAAAVLHISQPALSHQIAAIERELGTRVIERLPRGIRPTAAGLAAAATNAAVDAIVAGLAVELAPIRVNAIAPEPSTPARTTLSATNARPRCFKPGPRPIPPDASARPTTSRPRRWRS